MLENFIFTQNAELKKKKKDWKIVSKCDVITKTKLPCNDAYSISHAHIKREEYPLFPHMLYN